MHLNLNIYHIATCNKWNGVNKKYHRFLVILLERMTIISQNHFEKPKNKQLLINYFRTNRNDY